MRKYLSIALSLILLCLPTLVIADTQIFGGAVDRLGSTILYDNYTIQTSIASSDLTVSLKTAAGADASASNPIRIKVNDTMMQVTSSLSVTVTDTMADIFTWDAGKIQGNDAQLFVYLINNNGTAQIGVSPCPTFATVATNYYDMVSGQTGSTGHTNIVMSGGRNATNSAVNIGRVNVKQADDNTWVSPTTSKVVNRAIYETDELSWTPTVTGFGTPPAGTLSKYVVERDWAVVWHREPNAGTSNSTSFNLTAPILPVTSTNMAWDGPLFTMTDNGAVVASIGHGFVLSNDRTLYFQKTPGTTASWTGTATGKGASIFGLRYKVS